MAKSQPKPAAAGRGGQYARLSGTTTKARYTRSQNAARRGGRIAISPRNTVVVCAACGAISARVHGVGPHCTRRFITGGIPNEHTALDHDAFRRSGEHTSELQSLMRI